MAAKKKSKKQQKKKSKRTARKTIASKQKSAVKKTTFKKRSLKKSAKKKAGVKAKSASRKVIGAKSAGGPRKKAEGSKDVRTVTAVPEGRLRSGQQSGDLQGLSDFERADSESVDELLEEGNAFEANVVSGVQAAGDAEESEVHTHEVPEDDVPDEYLDNEK
jgi:hypothetical protein